MFIAGILMMVSGRVAIGAVFWASANCMFLAARHFAKKKKQDNRLLEFSFIVEDDFE